MRSPKQILLDHLKRVRSESHVQSPTMEEVQGRVMVLIRNTVREMWPMTNNEQTRLHLKTLIDNGLREMIIERFVYNGGCDNVQVIDGDLRVDISIVPIKAVEWVTINFGVGLYDPAGQRRMDWNAIEEIQ